VRTKSEIAKYCDDFVGESCGANGRSNGDVHAFLRVRLELIEDGKQLTSLKSVTEKESKKKVLLTFCEQVKAKTCIGNVERKLGVNLIKWISPGGVMPLMGRK